MSDYIISIIRTWVPIAVGYLIAWGVVPSSMSDQVALLLGAVFTGAYYAIVRALEKKWSWFGWFLGDRRSPSYTSR